MLEEEPEEVEDFRDNWKMFSSERFNEVSLKQKLHRNHRNVTGSHFKVQRDKTYLLAGGWKFLIEK